MNADRCLVCGQPVRWARTSYGRHIVVDAGADPAGILVWTGQGRVAVVDPKQVPGRSRYRAHDASCQTVPL